MTRRWVVLEPAGAEREEAGAVFVRDAFAFAAFLVPALWLLWHRLWWAAAAVVLAEVVVGALAGVRGFGIAAAAIPLLVRILVALEGPQWQVRRLERRGYRVVAAVHAESRGEAEALYYGGPAGAHDARPAPTPVAAPAATPRPSVRRPAGRTLFDGA